MRLIAICWALMLGTTAGRPALLNDGNARNISADSLTKEAFVDSVYRTIVDSSFTNYVLVSRAHPCGMVKFDYDEWMKYGLREDVPFAVMQELALKASQNRVVEEWQQAGLTDARCIPEERMDSVLGAVYLYGIDQPFTKKDERRLRKHQKAWSKLPLQERIVFNFSYPLITDDGLYAVIDLDRHCDMRQCGLGITCIFRKSETGWKLAGRMVRWGGQDRARGIVVP